MPTPKYLKIINHSPGYTECGENKMSEVENAIETICESDCCGNGCRNCILDIKPVKISISGKINVLHKYSKFKLIDKKQHHPTLPAILELTFRSNIKATAQAADYTLELPPGHHVMLRAPLPYGGENFTRPYSPYYSNAAKMEFKILVNLKPQGPMSQYITKLQVEEEVEFRGPVGTYMHDAKAEKCICIVTQGVAIAPVLRIVEDILDNEDDMSRVVHLACFTDFEHIYFRERFSELNRFWNYKSKLFLAHQTCDSAFCRESDGCLNSCEDFQKNLRYKEEIYARKLNFLDLAHVINSFHAEKVVIVSGAVAFQDFISKLLLDAKLDIKDENIILL